MDALWKHHRFAAIATPSDYSDFGSMSRSPSTALTILRSPIHLLGIILLLVFSAELFVMIVLPWFPDTLGVWGRAVVDAILLTAICAPVVWWVIIRPLREIAMEEHQRSETIVANASEGIVTFQADGTIVSGNRAASELFGVRMGQLLGRSIHEFIEEMPVRFPELPITMKRQSVRSDGTTFPSLISINQYQWQSMPLNIALIRDQTAAEQAEQQRLLVARETEALRAQQMATLAQLATGVAHEIRNPLTSIKMLVQVNRSKLAEDGIPTDDLEIVVDEIRRMERSVNNLLEYARPQQQELTEFIVQDVAHRVVQLIQGRAKSQRVELEIQLPPNTVRIHADLSQIQQLLLNLCLNALDAMPNGGTLKLTIHHEATDLIMDVVDTGPGIDDEVIDRLFSPFVTTKPEGVGLGLGICRQIAEAHGGTLKAENIKPSGARFRLRLPGVKNAI